MRMKWQNNVFDSRGQMTGALCDASMVGPVGGNNREEQHETCDIVVCIAVNGFYGKTLTGRVRSKLSSSGGSNGSAGGGGWQHVPLEKEEDLQLLQEATAAAAV